MPASAIPVSIARPVDEAGGLVAVTQSPGRIVGTPRLPRRQGMALAEAAGSVVVVGVSAGERAVCPGGRRIKAPPDPGAVK